MRRERRTPRHDWRRKVQEAGLVWHTAADQFYWNEEACYIFSRGEIETIEAATAELYRIFLAAGQAVIDRNLFDRFAIPDWCVPLVRDAWDAEPPALNYGRFDLGYDGRGAVKLFAFNCDTPTSLLETAVVQWLWKDEVAPADDQFNNLHEKLSARWRDIAPRLSPRVHFLHIADAAGEDQVTVAYHSDLAEQAGLKPVPIAIEDVGWRSEDQRFVGWNREPIGTAFHLYPWDWLVSEPIGPHIATSLDQTAWIEPIWKLIWSNKAILPVLWDLFPGHPNLLEACFDPSRFGTRPHVRKPKLAREGANVSLLHLGRLARESGGDYGDEEFIAQALFDIPAFDGVHPVLGSWIVDGEPAGLGVREGGLITDDTARFVPHLIRD